MKRPAIVTVSVVALLLVVGAPFLRTEFGNPDRVLPGNVGPRSQRGSPQRLHHRRVERLRCCRPGALDDATATEVAVTISLLDDVARVDAPTGVFVDGQLVVGSGEDAGATFRSDSATRWRVVPDVEPISRAGQDLVVAIRALDGAELLVAGPGASLIDTKSAIADRLPLAGAIIGLTGLVILFAMLRSVLLPIKAIVLNLLSLTATFGSMVWIFQDGNGADLLGFTPTGAIDTTMPILMFCVAFGLSTVGCSCSPAKEEYDNGADTATPPPPVSSEPAASSPPRRCCCFTFGAFVAGGTTYRLFGLDLPLRSSPTPSSCGSPCFLPS